MASKYYPLRMWQSRSDVREAFKGLDEKGNQLNYRLSERIAMDAVMKRLQTGGVDFRKLEQAMPVMTQETQGVLAWAQWALSGKRILHFTPELTQAFLHSDCGDMRIDDVTPDFPHQYFHFNFPEGEEVLFANGQVALEGAFVLYAPQALRVVLAGKPVSPMPVDQAYRERYDLRIKAEHYGKPAQEALDLALADDLADLRAAQQVSMAKGSKEGAVAAGVLAERQQEDHEAFRIALRLVLNGLAYLKIEAQDKVTRWPEEAPQKLVNQSESGSPKELERAKSKLWSLGHVPIFHIGEEFGRQYRAPHAGVKAHWRRGHWRRQAHGPQLSLRKLIWIYPALVAGAEEAMAPAANKPAAPASP